MKIHGLRKMFALAGLLVVGAMAQAVRIDATIKIDRAINSPTLTVRYSGAVASMIELKLNGDSLATRSLSSSKDAGETNFTLDLSTLRDGDNIVEIVLYDKAGKVVGTEKTVISTDDGSTPAPFFVSAPKMGQAVQGPVEIKVGFNENFTNSYVSFFVDNQLKSISNTPPFSFVWDTEKETNGWHELESWLVDDTSTTYKTRKIRVFVNNPSGRTNRHFVATKKKDPVLLPKANPSGGNVTGTSTGVKPIDVKGAAVSKNAAPMEPKTTTVVGIEISNSLQAGLSGNSSGLKPAVLHKGIETGLKHLAPTGSRLALNAKAHQVGSVAKQVNAAASLIPITRGTRLPNLGFFEIAMNGEFVNFDVMPRVDDGVPMTPLRYLLEKEGGKVGWENLTKTVSANADGNDIWLKIGDPTARVNSADVQLERAPYIDGSRTIVPLSFIRQALKVDVQYDKATGHVLITSAKK